MIISIIKNKNKIYTCISIITLIILWKLLSLGISREIILPSPENVYNNLIIIILDKDFTQTVGNTLLRTIIGFFLSFISAIILGIIGGHFKAIYYLLNPIVTIIKSTPTMAVILLTLIWLGSEKAPILVGFLVIFPLIYTNVIQGIKEVDSNLLEMIKMYNVKPLRIVTDLYFPSIRSYLMAGSFTALGLNLKVIIAAEVLSQPKKSIGTSFMIEKVNLNTSGVFAWALIAIVLSSLFDFILRLLQSKIEKWE